MSTASRVLVEPGDLQVDAIRAAGPGGQNVHKVSSAVHLRLDIRASSLPEAVKARLLALPDRRISQDGVIVIKAQTERSRALNLADAVQRLQDLVDAAATPRLVRRATKPTRASKERRLQAKAVRGQVKAARRAPVD